MVQEKKSKRLSRKLQKSYVIKTDIDELSDVLCELYERFFSLHPDDAEKEELLKEQIYQD